MSDIKNEMIGITIFALSFFLLQWKKINLFVVAFIFFLYLSLNGVLVSFFITYVYFEILCFVGNCIRKNSEQEDIIKDFLCGISIWGSWAIIFSLFKYGNIIDLRIMTIILFLIFIVFFKNNNYKLLILRIKDFYHKCRTNHISILLETLLACLILILFGKSSVALEADSLIYGLRPEYVLVGNNSFYDYLGFASYFFYYPKLMEVLYLPVSGLGNPSFIINCNILIFVFIIYGAYKTICRVNSENFNANMALVLLFVSIPAVANTAVTAKPDILGFFFSFCMFRYFIEYMNNKDTMELFYVLLSFIFMTGTKILYFLWGGLLLIAIILIIAYMKYKDKFQFSFKYISIKYYLVLVCGCFFTLGIHYRTFKLTGYPIYPFGIELFRKIGFHGIYPMKTLDTGINDNFIVSISGILTTLYQVIFNPNNLPHIIMMWTSSILVFLVIIFVILFNRKIIKCNSYLQAFYFIIVLFYFPTLFYYYICTRKLPGNPDGNYYIFPIFILCILLSTFIMKVYKEINKNKIKKITIYITIILFLILHFSLTFIMHPSWHPGTRRFDKFLIEHNFEKNAFDSEFQNKYQGISEYMQNQFKGKRSIASSNIDIRSIYLLNSGIEYYSLINSKLFSNEILAQNYSNFVEYIQRTPIEGFLVSKEDDSDFSFYVNQYINEYGYIDRIENNDVIFYHLFNFEEFGNDIQHSKISNGRLYDDNWITKNITFGLYTGNGVLHISGDLLEHNSITIYINDQSIYNENIESNNINLVIPTNYINKYVIIKMNFEKDNSPASLNLNNDNRRIAFRVKRVYME